MSTGVLLIVVCTGSTALVLKARIEAVRAADISPMSFFGIGILYTVLSWYFRHTGLSGCGQVHMKRHTDKGHPYASIIPYLPSNINAQYLPAAGCAVSRQDVARLVV